MQMPSTEIKLKAIRKEKIKQTKIINCRLRNLYDAMYFDAVHVNLILHTIHITVPDIPCIYGRHI